MKILKTFFLFFSIASVIYSQNNITNTLGTSGAFYIKYGSSTFFTLSQADGLLSLNNNLSMLNTTSSSIGVINKGASRFIHNFAPSLADGMNTFVGINSGNFTMSGSGTSASYNTGIGSSSLISLTTGNNNTAVGYSSLSSNTTGYYNTAAGSSSLYYNTSGYGNTASGYSSLNFNTTGYDNTASGAVSLYSNTTGNYNTALGAFSLYFNSTGSRNTASGYYSLYSNTTGYNNTATGNNSLSLNTTGNNNTAVGYFSLSANTTGYYNTAAGSLSLYSNTIGNYNTASGSASLQNNTTGNNNTALGYHAGYNITTGSNLTCLGYDVQPSIGTATNEITLGNSFVTSLRCNVTTITSLSDARDKRNINDLNLGIDFLMKIKPRLFNWDKREWYDNNISDGSKMQKIPTAGFIAQELDEVQTTQNSEWLKLVLKDNPEKLEATPGNLLPIMVKAIQDLKKENDELKATTVELKNKLTKFEQLQNVLVTEIEKLKINNDETTKVSFDEK